MHGYGIMKMPDSPNTWLAFWAVLPEPIKAMLLTVALSFTMAFKNDGRTKKEKAVDMASGAVIVLIAGSAVELLGLSSAWAFIIGGALGGFGVAQVQVWFKTWADLRVKKD